MITIDPVIFLIIQVFMDPIPQCVEEITSAVGMTTFHILFETFYRNLGFK
jgi:hypothetical protein